MFAGIHNLLFTFTGRRVEKHYCYLYLYYNSFSFFFFLPSFISSLPGLNPSNGFRCRIPECDREDFSFSGEQELSIYCFCIQCSFQCQNRRRKHISLQWYWMKTRWRRPMHFYSDFGPELFPPKSNGEPDYCRFYKVGIGNYWKVTLTRIVLALRI